MFTNAEAYERFMGRWSKLLAPVLLDFAQIPDSAQILDIGSGTGALAFAIALSKPSSMVAGIEPSSEYVEYARASNPFPDRVTFTIGNAQQMDFPDGSFQSVLSLLAWNFIPDPRQALREATRVTQPGGSISAAVWEYGGSMRMLRVFWDAAASLEAGAVSADEKHMPLCRPGELAELWREAGLENVQQQALDVTMPFASFLDYWEPFLLGQGPAGAYVLRRSADQVNALQARILRGLELQDEKAPFALAARAWGVRGTVPPRA